MNEERLQRQINIIRQHLDILENEIKFDVGPYVMSDDDYDEIVKYIAKTNEEEQETFNEFR